MERLRCFICSQNIAGSLNGLVEHLKYTHGLTLHRGYKPSGFECGQEGCKRRFSLFNSFRQHIRKVHLRIPEIVNEELLNDIRPNIVAENVDNINNDDFDALPNNIDDREHENLNEELQEDSKFNLRTNVVRMICRMQAKPSMTGNTLSDIIDECDELLFSVYNHLQIKIKKFFEHQGTLNNPEVSELLQYFEYKCPFGDLRSLNQQIDALQTHCKYIIPKEIPLGKRIDVRINKECNTFLPKEIMNTCQYVSVIDTLTLVLSNKKVREAILSEQQSEDGVLSSFVDGRNFKTHSFFQRHPKALRLQLYYDDLEITNPLGSKTIIHKLGVWLYKITNIPSHMNSDLGSVHVL